MNWLRIFATGIIVFSQSLPGFANTFTMEEAVERALEVNPSIESAQHKVEASESSRKMAQGAFGPSLNSNYTFVRRDKERVNMGRVVSDRQAYSMGITASQPLFTGFNTQSTYEKSTLESQRQGMQLENTRLSMVAQVQSSFLAYLMAQENIRSIERAVARAQEQLDMAQAAYEVGLRPRLDVLQAELDLSRSRLNLIQAENNLETQRAQLNTLLALPVDSSTEYVGGLESIPFNLTLEQCLEMAFAQRPDLKMAETGVEIARKDLKIAQSSFYPRLALDFTWTRQGKDWWLNGTKAAPDDASSWQVGLGMQWNIFSSFQHVNNSRRANSMISSNMADVRQLSNNVAFEIKSLLLMAQSASRRVEVAEISVNRAMEAYNDAKMRYELQIGTNLDLLTAQSALSTEEAALITAKAEYLGAISKLYIALGEIHPSLEQ